jgi:hypothetical protein
MPRRYQKKGTDPRRHRSPETGGLTMETKINPKCGLTEFALFQNIPNPFSEQTFITFAVPPGSEWRLRVFKPKGETVRAFSGNEGGIITLSWNGEDDTGRRVESGTYFCCLECGGQTDQKKLTLMR